MGQIQAGFNHFASSSVQGVLAGSAKKIAKAQDKLTAIQEEQKEQER